MRLNNEVRRSHSDCFICRWAGSPDAVIWPQQMIKKPTVSGDLGVFHGYVNSHGTLGLRSTFCNMDICLDHWPVIVRDWASIAQEELDLDRAWHNYVERMER